MAALLVEWQPIGGQAARQGRLRRVAADRRGRPGATWRVFERDPAAPRGGSVAFVAEQVYPRRVFDLVMEVTFPREPDDLATAMVDTIAVVRRAPLGYH